MHQSGHSRAHSMQTVQFSASSAITPRERGGRSGATSGYCCVVDRRVIVFNVTASPFASPTPGTPTCTSCTVGAPRASTRVDRDRSAGFATGPGRPGGRVVVVVAVDELDRQGAGQPDPTQRVGQLVEEQRLAGPGPQRVA